MSKFAEVWLLILFTVAVTFFGWWVLMGNRYEVVSSGQGFFAWKVDRLTGTVWSMRYGRDSTLVRKIPDAD